MFFYALTSAGPHCMQNGADARVTGGVLITLLSGHIQTSQ